MTMKTELVREYLGYRLGNAESAYRLLYQKISHHTAPRSFINGKPILKTGELNHLLSQMIASGEPFMLARFGSTELNVLNKYICKTLGIIQQYPEDNRYAICNNAGFFPDDEDQIDRFAVLMLKSCAQLDIISLWNETHENYIIRKYAPQSQGTLLAAIRPCFYDNTWTRALADKRVVVVHPFSDSIRMQYQKRTLIYPNGALPEFDLRVVKAVQTIAGNRDPRFESWFDALDYMENEVFSEPFDIAILGCGAYGFPLAARIKLRGKQAIHLGGTTQLMFGIKGARWDNNPEISRKLYNENWIYPLSEDTPPNIDRVEGGCYWK